MKVPRWLGLILIIAFLAACNSNGIGGNGVSNLFATPTPLPPPSVGVTPAPDANAVMTKYLQALQKFDYQTMYSLLTQESQAAISADDFSKRWKDAIDEMSAASIDFTLNSSMLSPFDAQVAYSVTYKTVLVGDIQRNILVHMKLENGDWRIVWDDGQILPELAGGNQLAMEYSIPARGDIYDRNGKPIVSQADAYAFGIQTDQINPDTSKTLKDEVGKLCGYDPKYIQDQIDLAGPGWYLPMCEGTKQEAARLLAINPGGLVIAKYSSRYYFETGLAPQAVGYTLSISKDEFDQYRRLGYRGDEKVGHAGIEKWAEDYLAGKHGGILRVISPTGQILATLGQSDPQPADSVYLTLDENMQYYAQQAIQYFRGAVVVMEVNTGRVIAMASSPGFDPNMFEPTNPNNAGLTNLLNDPNNPLLNRATQGQYPLGSVFKIITMSAALESGLYLKDTPYNCQYDFTELPDRVLHDWTWSHCQDRLAAGKQCNTSDSRPSGLLTLQEGLMRSCDPYFWHIGLDLYSNWQRGTDIANMARGFGLGAPTGIDQVTEASGQILDPKGPVDAVNQAIGQGDVLVTPLQVADFIAAVANGGTLYRPQIVEKIQPVEGNPILTFKPQARGTLPIRLENLDIVREAMTMVTKNPRGTAYYPLLGLQFDVAGKTGTAESGSGKPHAWFTGYTMNSDTTGLPDIAIAVIVENQGEGADYALPLFRAMVETYYYGSPQSEPTNHLFKFGEPLPTPTPLGGIPTRTKRP